jgi:hypothetical protein
MMKFEVNRFIGSIYEYGTVTAMSAISTEGTSRDRGAGSAHRGDPHQAPGGGARAENTITGAETAEDPGERKGSGLMAEDNSRPASRADAFCRSAGASPPPRGQAGGKPKYPPQRLPGFESGRIDQIAIGEIVGWRWWKVIAGGLFTFNGSKPVPSGPFEADFPSRGGLAAFKRREDAERMFDEMRAKWSPYPQAVTFQSELPPGAPRVAPDAYCLGSVELWGSVYEYKRGYLGQFVCVKSVNRVVGGLPEHQILAFLNKKYPRIMTITGYRKRYD